MVRNFLQKLVSDAGNPLRYRFIYTFCFIIHSFYFILFLAVGVPELMIFNIFSSLMYFTGMIAIRSSRRNMVWLLMCIAEIMSHGLLCSAVLGSRYLFILFGFAIAPITFFIFYLDKDVRKPVILSSVLAGINLVTMVVSLDIGQGFEKYSDLPPQFSLLIAKFNVIIVIIILVSFSWMFIGKINIDLKTLKENNEALDRLANYDQLTGLRNRNHIREIFWEYIISKEPYSVILGDIDDFKHVNDTYGHSAGDEVLKTVALIIKETIGDNGEVCRWGGEEILMICKGPIERGAYLAGKVLDNIRAAEIENGNRHIKVTMTFGISDDSDARNIEKLISIADERLYAGKNSGKNRVVTES